MAPLREGGAEEVDLGAEEQAGVPAEQKVTVSDIASSLQYAVYLGESLESDSDQVADLVADGRLIGLRFTIRNEDDQAHTFIGLEIVDDNGERYSYVVDVLAKKKLVNWLNWCPERW